MAGEGLNLIQLIVYDFDGVMTDNRVYVDQDGREMVRVNRADGLGISGIKKLAFSKSSFPQKKTLLYPHVQKNLVSPVCRGLIIRKKL